MCELLKDHHRLVLRLEEAERVTLQEAVRHHRCPQVRERCGALLKIAEGLSPHAVAQQGLLQRRDPDSLYRWLDRYQQEGIMGVLTHRHGGSRRRFL